VLSGHARSGTSSRSTSKLTDTLGGFFLCALAVLESNYMTIPQRLLQWYDKHGRDLPWRKTRDPYRILVSEIMLQQTQVSRGLIFYDRWLKQFPNWNKLAIATNSQVIHAWAGLGYNRRALMLRDIARQIVETNRVSLVRPRETHPMTESGWRELKGIGPYTAAAISAFALRQRTLPIDTNIRRVLGRLLFGTTYPQPTIDDKIRANVDRVLPKRGRFYDVPQAIFDLATTHCTKVPTCATCPMRTVCPAAAKFLSGKVRVPKQMVKKAVESRHRDKRFPDRIYRGRILKFVRENGTVALDEIGPIVDATYDQKHDLDWVVSMVERMITDRLIRRMGDRRISLS